MLRIRARARRLMAMQVLPTPPWRPPRQSPGSLAVWHRPCRKCRSPIRPGAASRSSSRIGWERNSLAAHRLEDQVAVAGQRRRARSIRACGAAADQFDRFVRTGVDRHDGDVGSRLGDNIGEELVSRGLGFQPDHLQADQHCLEASLETRRLGRRSPVEERYSWQSIQWSRSSFLRAKRRARRLSRRIRARSILLNIAYLLAWS